MSDYDERMKKLNQNTYNPDMDYNKKMQDALLGTEEAPIAPSRKLDDRDKFLQGDKTRSDGSPMSYVEKEALYESMTNPTPAPAERFGKLKAAVAPHIAPAIEEDDGPRPELDENGNPIL